MEVIGQLTHVKVLTSEDWSW